MKIELLDHTPVEILAIAAGEPYQSECSEQLVERVWGSGHRSIARHGMASFKVVDVSQTLLRQISRHPHVSLTVKSSRYCDMSKVSVVVPPFLKDRDFSEYLDDYRAIMAIYEKWNNRPGYTQEQQRELAKLFLPLGSTTEMVVSGNYQALYEFLQLRVCVRAEWEIRQLAVAMAEMLKNIMPTIFTDLGCKGDEFGYCPEGHGTCGKYPRKAA